jgi:hypothetical protein
MVLELPADAVHALPELAIASDEKSLKPCTSSLSLELRGPPARLGHKPDNARESLPAQR